jgi:hypothetical protein
VGGIKQSEYNDDLFLNVGKCVRKNSSGEKSRLDCGCVVWSFQLDEWNGWCSRSVYQASLGGGTDRNLVVVCSMVELSR